MPLRKQLIEVPLSAGLNQKADTRSLMVTGAVQMTNCVALKDGAIRKRAGHAALTKTAVLAGVSSTIAACAAGGSFKGAPWLCDGGTLYTYSDNAAQWATIDVFPEAVALDRIPIDTGAQGISDADVTYAGGYIHVAYNTGSNALYVMALDASTGAVVAPPRLVAQAGLGGPPRLMTNAAGTLVVLCWTGSGSLLAASFAAGSAQYTTSPTNIQTGLSGQVPFDAAFVDQTRFAVAVEHPSGTIITSTVSWTSLAVLVTRTQTLAGGATTTRAFSVTSDANTIWVTCVATTATPVRVVDVFALNNDGTLSVLGAPTALYTYPSNGSGKIGVAIVSPGAAFVVWSGDPSPGIGNAWTMAQNIAAGGGVISTIGGTTYTGGAVLQSRPFPFGGVAYAVVATPSALQGTTYLAALDGYGLAPNSFTGGLYGSNALRPVATVSPRLSRAAPITNSVMTYNIMEPAALGPSGFVLASLGYSSTSPTTQSLFVYPFDFSASSTPRGSFGELYDDEAISTGEPQAFDGNNLFGAGFEYYPEITASMVGSGGHLSAGQYQYTVLYSMVDSRGQIHRSSNGNVVTLTAVNNDTGTVVVPVLGFTTRRQKGPNGVFQAQSFAELYRTTAGGSIFYFVSKTPFPNNPTSATTASTQNTMSVSDTASDATISANAILYTTAQLANFNPPSARIAITHRNRFWLAGCDDPTQLWASKEVTPGEYPGFNEALLFNASGAIRGLASLDDKLVLFVQRGSNYGIEYLTGDGPTDEGTNSDWAPIQPIPCDTGAVDQRSIASGPFGVIFRGTTGGPNGTGGIFLLTRDLQTQYIGGPVEDTLAAFPSVSAISVHPNNGRVYVYANDAATPTSGVRLVWDYTHGGVWSTDTLTDPDTANTSAPAVSAWSARTATQGLAHHWATAAGRVYRESLASPGNNALDAGAWVPMTYQSAWMKPAMNGFARFWRVLFQADKFDNADLTLTYAFDYSSVYTETATWTAAQVNAFPLLPVVDLSHTVGNQKARAIQVKISDASPTGAVAAHGTGYSFAAITVELGVKDGRFQNVPIAQRK